MARVAGEHPRAAVQRGGAGPAHALRAAKPGSLSKACNQKLAAPAAPLTHPWASKELYCLCLLAASSTLVLKSKAHSPAAMHALCSGHGGHSTAALHHVQPACRGACHFLLSSGMVLR